MIQFANEELSRGRGRRNVVRRVFLDGRDVSNSCCAFDPETGFVTLYKRDRMGRRVRDVRGRSVKTFRRGQIRVVRGDKSRLPDFEFVNEHAIVALTRAGAERQMPYMGDPHFISNATAIRLGLRRAPGWRFWRWIGETTYRENH